MESKQARIKCKAAVAYSSKEPLKVQDIYVDSPKKGEIRIKIVGSGICRTDLHILDADMADHYTFPMILGHEASGIVESVGDGVTNAKVGDHVIPIYMPQCMQCKFCLNPKTNFCHLGIPPLKNVMPDGTTRFWTLDEKPIYNSVGCAAFSEYTVMAEESVVVIDKRVDLQNICLIGCCVATGFGNVIKVAKLDRGTDVAIFGLGGVGLATVMAAKECGAKRIIGVDVNEEKYEMAKRFGCNEFVNPNKLPEHFQNVEQLFQSYGGLDYTFECIGSVDTIRSAFESLNLWGLCVIAGLPPKGTTVPINPMLLLAGKKITGSCFGGFKPREGIDYLIECYLKGSLDLNAFITQKIHLQDINEGFDSMRSGSIIRTVIEFDK